MEPEKKFMEAAIEEAKKAAKGGDYAIGAVIIRDGKIIATGEDEVIKNGNPVLHAEIVAIQEATKKLGRRFLQDCILYTTHEPCPMCASAAVWAKLKGIVSGAIKEDLIEYSKKFGDDKFSWRTIGIHCRDVLEKGTPRVKLVEGFMRDECRKLFSLSK